MFAESWPIGRGLTTPKATTPRPNREAFNWRVHLIRKLIETHRNEPDGTGFWIKQRRLLLGIGSDLVASYALIALEIALGEP